jgi:hypothetical protein
MKYRKIEGTHNGKKYEVDVVVEEAFAYTGMQQCGWHIAKVSIDGKQYTSNSKHLNSEELHDFVTLNL